METSKNHKFICPHCEKSFLTNGNLKRHVKSVHEKRKYECEFCGAIYTQADNLTRHQNGTLRTKMFKCPKCKCFSADTEAELASHLETKHQMKESNMDKEVDCVEEEVNGRASKRVRFDRNLEGSPDPVIPSSPNEYGPTPAPESHQTGHDDDAVFENSEGSNDEDVGGGGGTTAAGTSSHDYIPGTFANPAPPTQAEFYEFSPNHCLALKMWRVTSDAQMPHFTKLATENSGIFKEIVSFLRGSQQTLRNEFIDFLKTDAAADFGKFIPGLMIASHLSFQMELEILELLQQNKSLWPDCYALFVDKMMTHQLLRLTGLNALQLSIILESPDPTATLAKLKQRKTNASRNAKEANEILAKVGDILRNFLVVDICGPIIPFLDTSYTGVERSRKWTVILNVLLSQLGSRDNLLKKIIAAYHELESESLVYFTLCDGEMRIPVKFVREIVQATGEGRASPDALVYVSEQDVETARNLLYSMDPNPTRHQGRVTHGLYKIAKQLKIRDIWSFIFAVQSYELVMTESTKVEVLKILIEMGQAEMLLEIGEKFSTWIPRRDLYSCMNGLSCEQVTFFLDLESLDLPEMDILKITIHWACHQVGKPYNFQTGDSGIMEKFKEVRSVLRLTKLPINSKELQKCAYMLRDDLLNADEILNWARLEKPVWFSTKYRKLFCGK